MTSRPRTRIPSRPRLGGKLCDSIGNQSKVIENRVLFTRSGSITTSAIVISSDFQRESVGSPPLGVFLLVTYYFTIIPLLLWLSMAWFLYGAEFDSDSPDEMSSPEHISSLPAISPFICTGSSEAPYSSDGPPLQDPYVLPLLVGGSRRKRVGPLSAHRLASRHASPRSPDHHSSSSSSSSDSSPVHSLGLDASDQEIVEPDGEDFLTHLALGMAIVLGLVEDMLLDVVDAVRDFYHHMSRMDEMIYSLEVGEPQGGLDSYLGRRFLVSSHKSSCHPEMLGHARPMVRSRERLDAREFTYQNFMMCNHKVLKETEGSGWSDMVDVRIWRLFSHTQTVREKYQVEVCNLYLTQDSALNLVGSLIRGEPSGMMRIRFVNGESE
ncbi:hypothetical protein Tco_0210459 [Tanacetum coccineum]